LQALAKLQKVFDHGYIKLDVIARLDGLLLQQQALVYGS